MNKAKILLFTGTILILATAIFSFVFLDNGFLISKWNIALDPPGFRDSRQFAWASEAHAQGYDPLVENPVNPRGHQLNYPRIWHLLFALGINESHTNILGTIVTLLFFIGLGIFWFSNNFDTPTYVLLSIIILSPAVMLGIERSNIELILFFILSLALIVNYYSQVPALSLFIFASILKIYPVFGFIYLLKEQKKRFWTLFLSASGIFFLYAILSLNDFMLVYKTTPKIVGSSFGINVWWMGIQHKRFFNLPLSETLALSLKTASYIIALLIVAGGSILSVRSKHLYSSNWLYIDAFRVGAGIFVGCFLLMNTHDYRLIFLIFTVPQLVVWLNDSKKNWALVPVLTLTAMIFSLWSPFIMRFLGRNVTFILEETSNWIMLSGLLYLLFSSLPEWCRDYISRLFPQIKHQE